MDKLKLKKRKIVFVGLSGGVDSSVSAALLKEGGFDVRGVFIKVWQPEFWGGCSMKEDRLDAMRVCAKLNIPFYTLNLEKEYKKEVVDYMIEEYASGRTPNPDVMCNKYVKFGGFFDWAMNNGADYVATGHYARTKKNPNGDYQLLAGKDKNKDQSYFLWTLTQKQISKTIFPVGNIEKTQVRKIAKKFGLATEAKKDSQGLCFIGKIDMTDFLKVFIPKKEGLVVNLKGEVIGNHDGVSYYTIGQRHGFEITKKSSSDDRYFIVNKKFSENVLVVSNDPLTTEDLADNNLKLAKVSWTMNKEPNYKKEYQARIRYRQPLEKCTLIRGDVGELIIRFKKPQVSPTPGQSIVLYDGDICLGGGIIS